MKNRVFFALIVSLILCTFSACKEEERDNRHLAYATIINATDKALTTDVDGELLYVQENESGFTDWTVGKRLIVDYSIVTDRNVTSTPKSYNVKLNCVYTILTKNPVKKSFLNTTLRDDSIGHDPINVRSVWFANSYLNIDFGIYRNDPGIRHFINLVKDDSKSTSDDVFVELRHNAYHDLQSIGSWGNVSFNISDFVMPPKSSVKIHLSRLTYTGEVKTDTLTYNTGIIY